MSSVQTGKNLQRAAVCAQLFKVYMEVLRVKVDAQLVQLGGSVTVQIGQ